MTSQAKPSRNLYLDVDGVLLGTSSPGSPEVVLARHAGDFLEFALERFTCYWLTTHCQGDPSTVLRYLEPYCDDAIRILLPAVLPTQFRTMKTEALAGDFVWLDDQPLACEIEWLRGHGLEDRWIEVNTRKRPDDLLRVMDFLRRIDSQV